MGHHDEDAVRFTHREATMIRQRIATFMLVLSVMIVGLVVTLAAVQSRQASCQDRAHRVVFTHLLRNNVTGEDVMQVVQDALAAHNIALDLQSSRATPRAPKTVDVLDTGDRVLGTNGYVLLRRSDGSVYNWELRTVLPQLCNTYPSISMGVLANVDYEKVDYVIKALQRPTGQRHYLLESIVTTTEKSRVKTFAQMQNLFPGFHQLSATSPRMMVLATYDYTVFAVGQAYFRGSPLDVNVHVEEWPATKVSQHFWRVMLSTQSTSAEGAIAFIHDAILAAFRAQKWGCSGSACDSPLDSYGE